MPCIVSSSSPHHHPLLEAGTCLFIAFAVDEEPLYNERGKREKSAKPASSYFVDLELTWSLYRHYCPPRQIYQSKPSCS